MHSLMPQYSRSLPISHTVQYSIKLLHGSSRRSGRHHALRGVKLITSSVATKTSGLLLTALPCLPTPSPQRTPAGDISSCLGGVELCCCSLCVCPHVPCASKISARRRRAALSLEPDEVAIGRRDTETQLHSCKLKEQWRRDALLARRTFPAPVLVCLFGYKDVSCSSPPCFLGGQRCRYRGPYL